jgi:hypothetical protein
MKEFLQPFDEFTESATGKNPAALYTWEGDWAVEELLPSPKSHEYPVIFPEVLKDAKFMLLLTQLFLVVKLMSGAKEEEILTGRVVEEDPDELVV